MNRGRAPKLSVVKATLAAMAVAILTLSCATLLIHKRNMTYVEGVFRSFAAQAVEKMETEHQKSVTIIEQDTELSAACREKSIEYLEVTYIKAGDDLTNNVGAIFGGTKIANHGYQTREDIGNELVDLGCQTRVIVWLSIQKRKVTEIKKSAFIDPLVEFCKAKGEAQ